MKVFHLHNKTDKMIVSMFHTSWKIMELFMVYIFDDVETMKAEYFKNLK